MSFRSSLRLPLLRPSLFRPVLARQPLRRPLQLPSHQTQRTMSAVVRDRATASFKLNHTMIRVKDPKASLDFYTRVLGMTLIAESKNEGFTLYFLAFAEEGKTLEELKASRFNREGVVELTHNWGTETDPDFKGYASGNDEPGRGFGHLCITCADVDAACARFEELGCRWKKRLTDGRMRNIAFLLDPDGYWVEVVGQNLDV